MQVRLSALSDAISALLMRKKHHGRQLTLAHNTTYVFFSKLGLGYLFCTVLIFILGVNYQNNLILMVAYLMLIVVLMAMLQGYNNLRGLTLRFIECPDINAHSQGIIKLELSHPRIAYSVALICDEYALTLWQLTHQGNKVELLLQPRKRGAYPLPRIKILSRYPFGLTSVWSYFIVPDRLFVYPAPVKTNESPFRALAAAGLDDGVSPTRGSDEFDGLKEYAKGNNLRHVSWKHYAKSGQLLVKQYVNFVEEDTILDFQTLSGSRESRLSKLAYLVMQALTSSASFTLKLPGISPLSGAGPAHCKACLRMLAEFPGDD